MHKGLTGIFCLAGRGISLVPAVAVNRQFGLVNVAVRRGGLNPIICQELSEFN
jgi:hypothetical protein